MTTEGTGSMLRLPIGSIRKRC